MAKAQFQSTETMRIRFSPFVNAVTGAYIIGTDTCQLNYRPPGGAPAAVAMSWDAGIQVWYYDFVVGSYVQGEWRFRGVSNDVNALPQWKNVIWGDYVDDITAAKTAAAAAQVSSGSADTKIGAPVATVSLDIAAISTKIGAPAISVSADIAGLDTDIIKLRKVATNRWKQDVALKQFIVYDDDGLSILFRFNTFDDTGVPAGTRIFERRPI